MVLVVNMTSFHDTGREDVSCLLDIGEHPRIKQQSYIKYKKSEELNYLKLMQNQLNRSVVFKEDASDILLKKIQEGAKKSTRLPNKFKKYFKFF